MMADSRARNTQDAANRATALRFWLLQILLTSKVKTNDLEAHSSLIRQLSSKRKKPVNVANLRLLVFQTTSACLPTEGRNLVAFPISESTSGLYWRLEARFFPIAELIEEALKCA